jgi:hypothetical protein
VGALHTVRTDRQRHVDAVVDHQARSVIAGELAKRPAQGREVCRTEVLLSHLDRREPRRQALAHDRRQITAPRLRAVGDEGEAQLVQSGRPSSGEDAVA